MGMTTALQNKLLDEYFAVERFMSLHMGSPGVGGSLAFEPALGTGYSRQSLAGKLSDSSGGLVVNASVITFPVITTEYGAPISDFAVSDALAGGVMGLFGSFTESLLKGVGAAYQYAPGTIRFQFR